MKAGTKQGLCYNNVTETWLTYEDWLQTDQYLQVCSNERPASRIVKVAFHEEIEKMGGVAADGAQLGVTALEDFVAQRSTHIGPAVKECTGKLKRGKDAIVNRYPP